MASATATLPASPSAASSLYQAVAEFLTTGAIAPTYSTAPAFRASSAATAHGASSIPTVTLSSSIVAGDFILVCMETTASSIGLVPTGWSNIAIANGTSLNTYYYYKFAVAGDIGATVVFGTTVAGWSISSVSYSGVWTACPFNPASNFTNGAAVTTLTAPTMTTTVANTLIIQLWATNLSTAMTPPATIRAQAANGTTSETAITEQSQAAAGATTPQVCTTASGSINVLQFALQGIPTVVSAPAGGWTFVDGFQQEGLTSNYFVWKSPSASNNAGVDWFLCIAGGLPGTATHTAFTVTACETYSTSTRIWNAPVARAVLADVTPSSGSSPPWAQVETVTHLLGTTYAAQMTQAQTAVASSAIQLVANADGIFIGMSPGTGTSPIVYVGAFTSLVKNSAITGEGGIVLVDFLNIGPLIGATRDPGPVTTANFANYRAATWWVGTTFQGNVNGTSTANDIYQAPTTTPCACLYSITKSAAGSNVPNQQGTLRGLLPTWIQQIPQTSCAWGDTVTEGSDTLSFQSGSPTNVWIDTSV